MSSGQEDEQDRHREQDQDEPGEVPPRRQHPPGEREAAGAHQRVAEGQQEERPDRDPQGHRDHDAHTVLVAQEDRRDQRVGERRDVRAHDVGERVRAAQVALGDEGHEHGERDRHRERQEAHPAAEQEHRPLAVVPGVRPVLEPLLPDLGQHLVEHREPEEQDAEPDREQHPVREHRLREVHRPPEDPVGERGQLR